LLANGQVRRPGLCAQAVGGGLVGRQLWFQWRKRIRGGTAGPPAWQPAYGIHDDALYKSTFTFYFSAPAVL